MSEVAIYNDAGKLVATGRQTHEAISVVMPKGSFGVMVGAMWHGGGANRTSDEWRVMMLAGYSLGWLRQEQNMYLAVPPERAREMPERLARVIGYNVHKPFLGWAADIQDPYDVITGSDASLMGGEDHFAELGLVIRSDHRMPPEFPK